MFPMDLSEISFLRLQQSMILPMQLNALDARCSLLMPLKLSCSWILSSKACTAASAAPTASDHKSQAEATWHPTNCVL